MLKQSIQAAIKDAMRAKDPVTLETLRFLLSTIKYSEIERQRDLTDEEVLDVLSKEVKKRREAIALFARSGRDGLVADEEVKLAVILRFLPKELTKDEIQAIVAAAIQTVGSKEVGKIMREVMTKTKGRADGALVSTMVKDALGN